MESQESKNGLIRLGEQVAHLARQVEKLAE